MAAIDYRRMSRLYGAPQEHKRLSGWQITGYLSAVGLSFPLCGWVVSCLWNWFALPLGAPWIGLWHGYGLYLLVGYLSHRSAFKTQAQKDAEQADISVRRAWESSIGGPLIVLLVGWIVRQWI